MNFAETRFISSIVINYEVTEFSTKHWVTLIKFTVCQVERDYMTEDKLNHLSRHRHSGNGAIEVNPKSCRTLVNCNNINHRLAKVCENGVIQNKFSSTPHQRSLTATAIPR
ncbi:hypothetical protein CDAR_258851 [Caerostris darwini]|uniref:Uncharacterized protein n=1 Tax=Caerostris darwini TaxID=1538125 RepID=A0AAV4QTG2_9ARAC|nr:hypothetical protein CDAR_258851 [Caerostris darwini]